MHDQDQLTDQEKVALSAWRAADPPPDFAERCVDHSSAPSVAPRAGFIAASVLVALSSAAIVHSALRRGPEEHGAHHALERTTVSVGARAKVVSEGNTELSWRVAESGAAEVTQSSGNAFYRVEPGRGFVVHTPEGDVRVLGTCFRVEVEGMRAASKSILGAAASAVIGATVVVSVYEGKVVTASPKGELQIEAGEAATLALGKAPEKIRGGAAAAAARAKGPGVETAALASGGAAAPTPELPEGMTAAQLYAAHRGLAKETDTLRGRVQELEKQLEEAKKNRSPRTYGLNAEELNHMADKCELRWDLQSLEDSKPDQVSPEDARKLGVSEDEREVMNRVMKDDRDRLVKGIRALYVEATGDTANAPTLGSQSMINEIIDKAPDGDTQRVFQKLARERAGLQAVGGAAASSPLERLMRLLTAAGDTLESGLAKELGPDAARAYRDQHDGFGSRHRSSFGCPKD
jgi:hypothetical protein